MEQRTLLLVENQSYKCDLHYRSGTTPTIDYIHSRLHCAAHGVFVYTAAYFGVVFDP